MSPFFLAPILQRMNVPEVGPVLSNTSCRVITIFTGLPDFFDSTATTGSM